MNAVAQGSDGGGSIRIPSAFCGIYGIKATQGRVPRLNVGLGSWHPVNFSCMGPMSRTVRDSALLLQVLSGPHSEAEHGTIQDEPADYAAALGRGVSGCASAGALTSVAPPRWTPRRGRPPSARRRCSRSWAPRSRTRLSTSI